MGAATYTQEDSQFRNDNGDINTATYIGALNSNQSFNVDTVFRWRGVVQVGGMAVGNISFRVFAQKNGVGGYLEITTSSTNGLQLANDANSIPDDETTDQEIGDGTYTTGDSEGYEDGTSTVGTGNVDFGTGEEAEIEFCLQMPSGDANDGDYFDLRIYRGTTALNTYPGSDPRATAIGVTPDDMLPWDFKKRRFDALLVR